MYKHYTTAENKNNFTGIWQPRGWTKAIHTQHTFQVKTTSGTENYPVCME